MTKEEFESILIPKDTKALLFSNRTVESIKKWYRVETKAEMFSMVAGIQIRNSAYLTDFQYIALNEEHQIIYVKDISIKEKELDKLSDRL